MRSADAGWCCDGRRHGDMKLCVRNIRQRRDGDMDLLVVCKGHTCDGSCFAINAEDVGQVSIQLLYLKTVPRSCSVRCIAENVVRGIAIIPHGNFVRNLPSNCRKKGVYITISPYSLEQLG